jgi:hypothetical protein
MKHPAAFCAGLAVTTFALFPGYLVVLFYCSAPWYDFRCILTCCGYTLAGWTGGKIGQCVPAYKDFKAHVTGYCHPIREASSR